MSEIENMLLDALKCIKSACDANARPLEKDKFSQGFAAAHRKIGAYASAAVNAYKDKTTHLGS